MKRYKQRRREAAEEFLEAENMLRQIRQEEDDEEWIDGFGKEWDPEKLPPGYIIDPENPTRYIIIEFSRFVVRVVPFKTIGFIVFSSGATLSAIANIKFNVRLKNVY